MRNPRSGKHSNWRKHYRDPKGPGVKASGSGVHDMQLMPPIQTPTDIFKYSTMELCSATAQYATSNEVSE
jgi:hypothetical protein